MELEIEHKFSIPADIADRITALDGVLVKDQDFLDIYVDNEEHSLVLSDTWVRLRAGQWQMKFPPAERLNSDVLQYQESADESFIQQHVAKLLHIKQSETVLENLKPIMEIRTLRRTYKLGQLTIDLDQTDFGYSVGEVEMIARNGVTPEEAEQKVNEVIQKLDVQIVSRSEGKVHKYLQIHNKSLYDKLIAAGVLLAECIRH